MSSSSGVRLSAALVDPLSWMSLIQRLTVERPRSYSFSISATGLPLSYSSTIRRLKASSNFLGCFGPRIRCSFLLTSDVPHLIV